MPAAPRVVERVMEEERKAYSRALHEDRSRAETALQQKLRRRKKKRRGKGIMCPTCGVNRTHKHGPCPPCRARKTDSR